LIEVRGNSQLSKLCLLIGQRIDGGCIKQDQALGKLLQGFPLMQMRQLAASVGRHRNSAFCENAFNPSPGPVAIVMLSREYTKHNKSISRNSTCQDVTKMPIIQALKTIKWFQLENIYKFVD
jgi:hypothetical protein